METLLYIVFPYLAMLTCLIGSIIRIRFLGYTIGSFSSQFFESKLLYWGSRMFHTGIVILLLGHLVGLIIPRSITLFTNHPLRLVILEVTAFAFALMTFVGVVILLYRRIKEPRVRVVTRKTDFLVYGILLLQIITGIWVAYFHRWGISWYTTVLAPYIHSFFTLSPDISAFATLPVMIKVHALSGFAFIAIIPFTRLIHFFAYPYHYFYRQYLVFVSNINLEKINH